ncbi:MAG: cytochrome C [Deltaproteobacteria bacterium]|nr:cytochrome C [Deltaproteobacteria bacterium]
MQKQSVIFLITLLGMVLSGLLLTAGTAFAQPTLTVDDCIKCHEKQPREIEEAGGAHKEQLNCQDCHADHRPASKNNIPQCSMCHEGSAHYELKNCLRCHNPHQPLRVVLTGELKAECLTCHTDQNEQMLANPSKHATFACNFCHADKHGVIPECVQCHEPHSDNMTQADCSTCHQAHQPLVLEYADTTPNILCAACHEQPYNQLMDTKTKHHERTCVECHQNKHKTIPQCSDCHGLPHAEGIHKKFPVCGSCHNTAHDLNNLSSK